MLASSNLGYVAAGWGIALVTLAAYAVRTIRRGRALARRVPAAERRWT